MKKSENKWEYVLYMLVMGLILLHPFACFTIFGHSIGRGPDEPYPVLCYVLSGVHLLVLAAALVFMVCQRKFELAKGWKVYWLFCGSALAVAVAAMQFGLHGNAFVLLAAVCSPSLVWMPWWEALGIQGNGPFYGTAVACFFCWATCQLFVKKAK